MPADDPPRRPEAPRQYFVPAPGGARDPGPAAPRQPTRKPSVQNQPGQRPPAQKQPGQQQPAQRQAPQRTQPAAPPRRPTGPPTAPSGVPRRRRRRRVLWAIPVLVLLVLLGGFLWARSTYDRIERVDLEGVLDPVAGDATNYLLVGSDSRDQLDPEQDSGVEGRRADTLIVLRITPAGAQMMSIPRDLWVTLDGSGEMGRINGAYNNGPAALVRTVQDNLDVPVNHYMEVGFASFVGLVDAIGGVSIDFEHAARDEASGLYVDSPGTHVLDGQQALAYARSREYTEVIDGQEVREPTADLGRQQRQQLFLRSALGEVGSTRNPIALARVANAMSDELIVDSGLGMGEAFSLVRRLGSSEMETVILPTVAVRHGSAAVLELAEPEAQVVLDGFR